MKTVSTGQVFSIFSGDYEGDSLACFPTAFSSHPSAPVPWDLSLAKTHGAWLQELMKLRLLMSHGRKNSVRVKVIGKKWIYLERNTHHR